MERARNTAVLNDRTFALRALVGLTVTIGLAVSLGIVLPVDAAGAPVVLIVMEDKGLKHITPEKAPYMTSFAQGGRLFTNLTARRGGSLRQYIYLVSGYVKGCSRGTGTDDNIFNQVGDWQSWQESMEVPCQKGEAGAGYTRSHNPALCFANLNDSCTARLLPYPTILPETLARFTQVTPNNCSNTHNCGIPVGDAWLAAHVPPLLAKGAIVIITFEAGRSGDGRLWTAMQGPGVPVGVVDSTTPFSHGNMLAGLQDYFGVPRFPVTQGLVPVPIP